MVELNHHDEGVVCIPNIGLKERRKRFNFGLILLIVGVIIGIVLILIDWSWWTRFALFLPFFAGFSGIIQAREKT